MAKYTKVSCDQCGEEIDGDGVPIFTFDIFFECPKKSSIHKMVQVVSQGNTDFDSPDICRKCIYICRKCMYRAIKRATDVYTHENI